MSLSEQFSSNHNTKTTFIDEIESNPHDAIMKFIEKNMPITTSRYAQPKMAEDVKRVEFQLYSKRLIETCCIA